MEVILDAKQIKEALNGLLTAILADNAEPDRIAVIGIRSRGEIIAQRLCKALCKKLDIDVPCGVLDITLYRDDLNDPRGDEQPTVRSTEIPFDVSDLTILLVDDVLHTGRSVRAAMDALVDLGRPNAIRLAVLVDRGHHELPIQADYAGLKIEVPDEKSVAVMLEETDDTEQVVIE